MNPEQKEHFNWPERQEKPTVHHHVMVLGAIALTIVIICAIGYYIYHGMNNTPADMQEPEVVEATIETSEPELTYEEKVQRLEEWQNNEVNISTPELTYEEKVQRLEEFASESPEIIE